MKMKESNKHNQLNSNQRNQQQELPSNKKFIVINNTEDLNLVIDNIDTIIKSKMIVVVNTENVSKFELFSTFQSINQFVILEYDVEKMSHGILKFVSEGEMTEASKSDVVVGEEEYKNAEIRKMFEQN